MIDKPIECNETDTLVSTSRQLVVHNDEVNTFDWVIKTLVDVCGHDSIQAEQCTILIHFKGKCSVRHGGWEELKPMKDKITERGIQATID